MFKTKTTKRLNDKMAKVQKVKCKNVKRQTFKRHNGKCKNKQITFKTYLISNNHVPLTLYK